GQPLCDIRPPCPAHYRERCLPDALDRRVDRADGCDRAQDGRQEHGSPHWPSSAQVVTRLRRPDGESCRSTICTGDTGCAWSPAGPGQIQPTSSGVTSEAATPARSISSNISHSQASPDFARPLYPTGAKVAAI